MEGMVAGIDVAKDVLVVAIRPSGERLKCKQDARQREELAKKLVRRGVTLVVLEATGGFERPIAEVFERHGLAFSIVNPRQARDFAKATGRLEKTDDVDADSLAHFGEAIKPKPTVLPSKEVRELQVLVERRRELVELITADKNRLRMVEGRLVKDHIERHLQWLESEVDALEKVAELRVDADDSLAASAKILRSAKGVGPIVATVLLAELPELGRLGRKQIAKLVGVAPLNRDSGTSLKGARTIWGGRSAVRAALYMATLSAIRSNPTIRDSYVRLVSKGKAKKVAIVASMRKLLICLNSMLRDKKEWQTAAARIDS